MELDRGSASFQSGIKLGSSAIQHQFAALISAARDFVAILGWMNISGLP